MIWIVGVLAAMALPTPADPAVVDALHRYGECFREHALQSKEKRFRRKTRAAVYVEAKASCAAVRATTAQIVSESWRARGEAVNDPTAVEKFLDYYLEGERYQIDAENMASFKD